MSDPEGGEALQQLRREIETMDRAIGQYDFSEPPRLLWEGLKRSDVLAAIDRAALRSPAPPETERDCDDCGGHGWYPVQVDDDVQEQQQCAACQGTGRAGSPAPQPDPPEWTNAVTVRGLARALHALGFDLRTRTTDPVPFAAKSGNRDADAAAILTYLRAQPEAALDVLTELEAYARSHGALKAGRGNVDDVLGFISWFRLAARDGSSSAPQDDFEKAAAADETLASVLGIPPPFPPQEKT